MGKKKLILFLDFSITKARTRSLDFVSKRQLFAI